MFRLIEEIEFHTACEGAKPFESLFDDSTIIAEYEKSMSSLSLFEKPHVLSDDREFPGRESLTSYECVELCVTDNLAVV